MNGTAALVLQALAPYHLRKDGVSSWRMNSPLRPGSNSEGFTLTLTDDEHGAYFDHVSSASGSLYELAEHLGIAVERKEATETKRAYKDIADYAEAHHISADVLTKNAWSDVQIYQKRPALCFKTATGLRYRFLDGENPPYKSELNYKSCWYGLKRAILLAEETRQALVLCNGEVSTLAAQHIGIAACAVTAGEKAIPNGLLAELKAAWQGAIILAYDCDKTGSETAQKVREQLADRNPAVIDLGFTAGGDLADFCALFGERTREELAKRAIQPVAPEVHKSDIELLSDAVHGLKSALKGEGQDIDTMLATVQSELDRIKAQAAQPIILSFDEIARDNLALIEYRHENPQATTGLHCNIPTLDKAIGGFEPELYVIYGATSMGKSTLAVSFAREFLKQAPGFIASTESDPRRWMMRLAGSICKIKSDRIESGQLSNIEYQSVQETYAHLRSMGCHMLQAGSPTVSLLRAAIKSGIEIYGYEWAIIDSASKMDHTGATGIYDVTRGVSNGLQTLWQELNIPIIVTNQIGRDVSERPAGKKLPQLEDGYGGGSIEQNAGVVIGLYNHQYYVEVGSEVADDLHYPPESAMVRILKNRWHGDARISTVRLKFVGGAGFYEMRTETVDIRTLTDRRLD